MMVLCGGYGRMLWKGEGVRGVEQRRRAGQSGAGVKRRSSALQSQSQRGRYVDDRKSKVARALSARSFCASLALFALGRERRRIHVDRKSTRLNSSHANISYAVFCLKKK